jgi:hypothetical protein
LQTKGCCIKDLEKSENRGIGQQDLVRKLDSKGVNKSGNTGGDNTEAVV